MAKRGFSPNGCALACQWRSLTVMGIFLKGSVLLVSPGTNIKNFGIKIFRFIRQGQLLERTTEKPGKNIVFTQMF